MLSVYHSIWIKMKREAFWKVESYVFHRWILLENTWKVDVLIKNLKVTLRFQLSDLRHECVNYISNPGQIKNELISWIIFIVNWIESIETLFYYRWLVYIFDEWCKTITCHETYVDIHATILHIHKTLIMTKWECLITMASRIAISTKNNRYYRKCVDFLQKW